MLRPIIKQKSVAGQHVSSSTDSGRARGTLREARVSDGPKKEFIQAAKISNVSLADFMRATLTKASREIIKEHKMPVRY